MTDVRQDIIPRRLQHVMSHLIWWFVWEPLPRLPRQCCRFFCDFQDSLTGQSVRVVGCSKGGQLFAVPVPARSRAASARASRIADSCLRSSTAALASTTASWRWASSCSRAMAAARGVLIRVVRAAAFAPRPLVVLSLIRCQNKTSPRPSQDISSNFFMPHYAGGGGGKLADLATVMPGK